MRSFTIIFFAGILISFIGSLPPGLMNLLAIQVTEKHGTSQALLYASGSMLAEILVVRIALAGMNWFTSRQRFFLILEWMTACLLILFAAACFVAAGSMQDFTGILPDIMLPPFITGMVVSLINPLHIPFWLGWSTVLVNKGVLKRETNHYNLYIAGIGAGTIGGFLLYIYGGRYIFEILGSNNLIINGSIGMVLLAAAFLHIRKMRSTPLGVRYAQVINKK